jgi:hypothetical protein
MKTIFSLINVMIAIAAGALVFLGYVFPDLLGSLRAMLLQWAVILAAFALLVGIMNLMQTHWRKVTTRQPKSVYSIVVLVSLVVTLAVTAISGPSGNWSLWIYNNLQVPIEISLMAVLAIVLVYVAVRLMRRRMTWYSGVFLVTVLLVMLSTAPLYVIGEVPLLNTLHSLISDILAVAGARGLLLGVALGTIAAGLRVLMGADRPYGG